MPSHTCIDPRDPEGDACLVVKFKITYAGSGPSWDHPGDPTEIEITAARDESGTDVYPVLSDDHSHAVEMKVLDEFGFNDHWAEEQAAWDEAESDR